MKYQYCEILTLKNEGQIQVQLLKKVRLLGIVTANHCWLALVSKYKSFKNFKMMCYLKSIIKNQIQSKI